MTPKDATEEDFEREVAWVLANLEALSPATRLPIAVERALKRGQAIERARISAELHRVIKAEMPLRDADGRLTYSKVMYGDALRLALVHVRTVCGTHKPNEIEAA